MLGAIESFCLLLFLIAPGVALITAGGVGGIAFFSIFEASVTKLRGAYSFSIVIAIR